MIDQKLVMNKRKRKNTSTGQPLEGQSYVTVKQKKIVEKCMHFNCRGLCGGEKKLFIKIILQYLN